MCGRKKKEKKTWISGRARSYCCLAYWHNTSTTVTDSAFLSVYTLWCACMSLSQTVCQWLVLYIGAVTASVCCLRDIRDHVCNATSMRAESWCWPQGLRVDHVRWLGAEEMRWHMLADRETPGCCWAERGDGLVADGSDSCQELFSVPGCVCVFIFVLPPSWELVSALEATEDGS